MNQVYWVFEFIKVLLAYGFIMYIWPSVVFRRHLSGKSRAYRFCFCVNMSIILINTGVLFLGLVYILNQILVAVLFWGIFLVQLIRNYDLRLSRFKDTRRVLKGTLSFRRMILNWHVFNVSKLKSSIQKWWKSTKGRRLEFALLLVILAFGTAYFSANALQVHSYGFGDQYVHHDWVYGLKQGNIFHKGIYPEGMHCFIYLMGTVFPIDFYSIVLFLAGAHIHVYLLSAYLLSRKLFGWRMSGMLALTGFLTIEQAVINGIFGISRLSWTLPQEFALYVIYMSAYALIGFLRQTPKPSAERFRFFKLKSWRRYFSDRYLFIFITAVAASICVHFYATIIAAFACIVIVLVYIRRLFRRGVFIKLAAGALIALLIAVTPMVGAFIEGHPLQGSLYWAMAVTEGTDEKFDPNYKEPASTAASAEAAGSSDKEINTEKKSLPEQITDKTNKIIRETFCELYGKSRGKLLLNLIFAVAGFSILLLICKGIVLLVRKRKNKPRTSFFIQCPESYLIIALCTFVMMMAYKPKLIGLPPLVAGTRVCSTIDVFSMLLYAVVFDILFSLLRPLLKERILKPISVIACAGIYVFAQNAGLFHGYLYYELTRYPVAVELTKEITKTLPKQQYTIISTTDELYQVIETGFHEEWIDFLEKSSNRTYTIPTPYLFFFIEKRPIRYAQSNFASGPQWLADEKYAPYYGISGAQYPEIAHGEISEEATTATFKTGKNRSYTASDFNNRITLESKAFAWYQKFSEIHPNDGEVIYEDDDFLCYCVHQNEFSLFSLGIMDKKQERGLH